MPDRPNDRLDEQIPFVEPDYSTFNVAQRGPEPYPPWLVTDRNALDTDLGVLKTGKEADVHLVERALPDGGARCLLAAKRYRSSEHRMFHRDAGYQEGRRTRRTRDARAIERRTEYGRTLIAGQWTSTEFAALERLWVAGAPVPYPVQCLNTEVMMQFFGDDDGAAAPRLAQTRPSASELVDLWRQCVGAMSVLARLGLAHGDLSPYNLLVHQGRLVMIDIPQIVDLVANPQGPGYLERDCRNVCRWFASRGLDDAEPDVLFGELMAEAVASW